MKIVLSIAAAFLLCSCGSTPQAHTSLRYDGQSTPAMDMTDPHFYYMDDDRPAPEFAGRSRYRSVDGFCASHCQSRGGSVGDCNRPCGF